MRERKIVYGGVPAPSATSEMMFMNSSVNQSSMKNYHHNPVLGATETQQTLVS